MYLSNTEEFGLWPALKRQWRVFHAIMLRNIRTKFFGNGLGYLVGIAWPLTHILIIVEIFSLSGRTAPYGDSTTLFVATGVVPFMTFSYLARFMMLAAVKAKPLLQFPEVKILDLLFATAILEILAAACVTLTLFALAWFFGVDAMPRDIVGVSYAYGAAILLGVGFGLLNSVIALAYHPWLVGYIAINILFYMSAGIFFVPDNLPDVVRYWISFLPVVQVIEWTRSAYYEGYGGLILDRAYVLAFGVVSMFIGLILERALRGHLLAYR
jgi:capsular polysaccharide transport system permease protein